MNPPRQRRSQETAARILDCVEELLREKCFADITLLEICERAEVSSSSLYSRFPSKEAIRHSLAERYRLVMIGAFSEEYARLLADPPTEIEVLTKRVVGLLVTFVRHHDHLVTALKVEEATTTMSYETEEMLVASLRDLGARVADVEDPASKARIEFAVRAAAAIVQRAVGSHTRFAERMRLSDDELVDAVSEMVVSYISPRL